MDDALKLQIDEWQGTIAHSIEQHPVPHLVKVRGLDYVMFPETMNPESTVQAMMRDSAHATLRNFFAGVGRHLKPDGRMRIVFSNAGNLEYFHHLVGECDFASSTVAQTRFASDVIMEVYELTRTSRPTSPPAPAVVDVETDRLAQR